MKNITIILSFFAVIIFFTLSIEAKKVSKKNAEYTGKAIVEYDNMFNAGGWFMYVNQCEGTFAKKFKQELGMLSWEDYKAFNAGNAKYSKGNYQVLKCDKTKNKEIIEWYTGILDYIKSETTSINDTSKSQITETKSSKKTKSNDTIKEKLEKLKSLFEDELITQDEYDAKRKEILDEM